MRLKSVFAGVSNVFAFFRHGLGGQVRQLGVPA